MASIPNKVKDRLVAGIKKFQKVLTLSILVALGGCANPYNKFYQNSFPDGVDLMSLSLNLLSD